MDSEEQAYQEYQDYHDYQGFHAYTVSSSAQTLEQPQQAPGTGGSTQPEGLKFPSIRPKGGVYGEVPESTKGSGGGVLEGTEGNPVLGDVPQETMGTTNLDRLSDVGVRDVPHGNNSPGSRGRDIEQPGVLAQIGGMIAHPFTPAPGLENVAREIGGESRLATAEPSFNIDVLEKTEREFVAAMIPTTLFGSLTPAIIKQAIGLEKAAWNVAAKKFPLLANALKETFPHIFGDVGSLGSKPIPTPGTNPQANVAPGGSQVAKMGTPGALPPDQVNNLRSYPDSLGHELPPESHGPWILETVPLSELPNKPIPGRFAPREGGSQTTGPIIQDSQGHIIDGNNRVYEAMARGDQSIQVYRPVSKAEMLDKWGLDEKGGMPADLPAVWTGKLTQLARNTVDEIKTSLRNVSGAELPMLRVAPNTPVKSVFLRKEAADANAISNLVEQPFIKDLAQLSRTEEGKGIEKAIDTAVKEFNVRGGTSDAYAQAVAKLPKPIQDYLAFRHQNWLAENEVLQAHGQAPIPEVSRPYVPKGVTTRGDDVMSIVNSTIRGGGEVRQGVGPFGEHGLYETFEQGGKFGIKYDPALFSILKREYVGQAMKTTAKMMDEMEGKVLFRTEAQARAATPAGSHAVRMEGLPFQVEGASWWARSAEEAKWLTDRLKPQDDWGMLRHYSNQLLRNPGLIVPWPHSWKNMGTQMLTAVFNESPSNVGRATWDAFRYKRGKVTGDEMAEFQRYLPSNVEGKLPMQSIHEAMPVDITKPTGPGGVLEKGVEGIGAANRPSASAIYGGQGYDQAMRFAVWKNYIRGGMDAQTAANHTTIDMIDYGSRSAYQDMLRFPGNFFTQWHTGVARSFMKHIDSAPARTLMVVGAIDLLRQIDYRQTGMWVPMPFDLIERPTTELVKTAFSPQAEDYEQGRKFGFHPLSAAYKALITGAQLGTVGPGGEFTLRTLGNFLNTLEGKDNWKDYKTSLLMISQWYTGTNYYNQWEASGYKDVEPIANLLGQVFLGRRPAMSTPPSWMMSVPESVLPKNPLVKTAEDIEEAHRQGRLLKQPSKEMRQEALHEMVQSKGPMEQRILRSQGMK